MKRDLDSLKKNKFDVIIIGGGVTGAAMAWDASLRGLKVALIEKKDFGHATSAATSKLIHGGLRYLENFEFSVVRESLRERRLLEKNIPHLAFPLPFVLPVYDFLPMPRFILKAGLMMYDLLSFDKNELPFSEKFLPNHHWLSKKSVLELEPRISTTGLKGGYLYYDVLNKYPERANMEYILSASEKGAVIANYTEFLDIKLTKNDSGKKVISGVTARDNITGDEFDIQGTTVINASGPWVDKVLSKLNKKSQRKVTRSKGIHLLLPRINNDCAITFSTRDKKHFFIIPWLDYTLVGTTDENFTGDLDNVKVNKTEALDFLNLIKEYYPADIGLSGIKHAYAGIRPLVVGNKDETTYSVSRKHEIIDHNKTDQISGLYSVIGGKWTTSRALAELTIDRVMKCQGRKCVKSETARTPLIGGRFEGSYHSALNSALQKNKAALGPEITAHLFSYYGNEYEKILTRIKSQPRSKKIINKLSVHTVAEIEHALEHESAIKLSDFLMRRSSIGNTGIPDIKTVQEIADVMANYHGWNSRDKAVQIEEYLAAFQLSDD